ncbi:MAG: molybdenum cofactor guanylyltransferase [Candidatus Thioglobus sp.]|uniref:molybdenum cofactor guanylyltransferase MobA n=1 Tax=Candidatus Thioglobus sp. TaxID=2026721 RepID=UPI00262933B3|nr:molybdenum cofactor guanylyltransferase MobA [Candidatus Thioglobus sp.]MDC9727249.1 molybdenum cofactor guanylyltransferase [Candidatus Thioglobus sp.]
METISKSDITALILAGGQARRMNGKDKGLVLYKDQPLIAYVATAIRANVDSIWVSANKNIDLYQAFGEVVSDDLSDFQGPLAGIAAALSRIKTKYLLVLPCDGPYVEPILIKRLVDAMANNKVSLCVASEHQHLHPTFSLLNVCIKPVLDQYLASGERRLGQFFRDNQALEVDFSDHERMFVNFNTPEDLLEGASKNP